MNNNENDFFKKLKSFVKFCDIIGKQPELKIGKKDNYQTILGGLLCIFIYCLVVIGVGYFGQDLVFKQNPIVTESYFYKYLKSPSFDEIINNFQLEINLENRTIELKNLITIEAFFLNKFNSNSKKIQVKNCESSSLAYCFSSNETMNDNNNEKFIIILSYCNKTENSKCYNNTETTKILSKTNLILQYKHTIFNPKNYSNPNFSFNESYETEIPSQKGITLNFENVIFLTDKGFMIEDYREINYIAMNEIFENSLLPSSKEHVNIEISFKDVDHIYYRQYVKVQKLIAEIGGLIKSFFVISYFFSNWYNEGQLYIKMIDSLFDSDEINKYFHSLASKNKTIYKKFRDSIGLKHIRDFNFKVDKINGSEVNLKKEQSVGIFEEAQMPPSLFQRNNFEGILERRPSNEANPAAVLNNNFVGEHGTTNANNELDLLKKNKKYKENFRSMKDKRFKLTFKEFFKIVWCGCLHFDYELTKKKIAFEAGVELIRSRLDVINLFKKMQEYDRFKNILMKDYQVILLNSLSKFMLDPETVNIKDIENINYDKFINSYLTSKSPNTHLDRSLTEWVKKKYNFEEI